MQQRRSSEGRREIDRSGARLRVIGTAFALLVVCVGIAVVFWQSDRAWGGLPPASGPGLILYGGTATMIALVAAAAVWSWLQWRETQ